MRSIKEFNDLMLNIKKCRLCENKFSHEPNPVVRGLKNAKIMQIGQAPSIHVHNSGIPFDDASGKRLREWYDINESIFYDERVFYMTSIGHCYPGKTKSGDKKPPKICSKNWLSKEIEVVDNEIYIVVGAMAANVLFPGISFDELVFHDQRLNGKTVFVIPHPSPLNVRWLKLHPEFLENRLPYIRTKLHQCIKDIF